MTNVHALANTRREPLSRREAAFQAVAAHLATASDTDLRTTVEQVARELHRRGMLPILADVAHEVALESQPAHALAATAAALDTHHNLGGLA